MISETVLLGIIVVCVLILSYVSTEHRWRKCVINEYNKLVKRLGSPDYVNSNPKGVSIWKKFSPCSPFTRIMLIDEAVPQFIPYKHYGFLYVTINYEIDKEMIEPILSCSESVMYDKLKRELTVRSNSLENAMVWLILIHDINKEKISQSQIQDEIKSRSSLAHCKSDENYTILQTIKDNYRLMETEYSCY